MTFVMTSYMAMHKLNHKYLKIHKVFLFLEESVKLKVYLSVKTYNFRNSGNVNILHSLLP